MVKWANRVLDINGLNKVDFVITKDGELITFQDIIDQQ